MPDARPRLVALSENSDDSPDADSRTPPGRSGRGPLLWILAGAFVLCALGWFFQAQETRDLAASMEATRTALGRAQAELRAYDQHLSQVGTQLGVVREQLSSLQLLVEEGPGAVQEP